MASDSTTWAVNGNLYKAVARVVPLGPPSSNVYAYIHRATHRVVEDQVAREVRNEVWARG